MNRMGAQATKRLRDVFHLSKDATLTFTARLASTAKLRSIGKMTELSIDTQSVRVRLELMEKKPIDVEILRYCLKKAKRLISPLRMLLRRVNG